MKSLSRLLVSRSNSIGRHLKSETIRRWIAALPLLVLHPGAAIGQQREPWINEPQQEWPTIALINEVLYKNGDRYIDPSFSYAGTGFLIDTGTDTLAATAKHILWIAQNKNSPFVEVNNDLQHWVMRTKSERRDSVVVGHLLNEDKTEVLQGPGSSTLERDWLVFSVRYASPNIKPLKPRYTPLERGETVYFLSCAYDDPACTIREGKVIRVEGFDIIIDRDMSVPIGGSSGSPVIDRNGYLVGIGSSSWGDPKTQKDVSVAISTEYLRDVLDGKQPLNVPKLSVSQLLLETVVSKGAEQAIEQYRKLRAHPQSYYRYNLRSSYANELEDVGNKLIELGKGADAIAILEFNIENGSLFSGYNLLATAYLSVGNKEAAIRAYENSIELMPDAQYNDAVAELGKLKSAK